MMFFWQIGAVLLVMEAAIFIAIASALGIGGAMLLCLLSAAAGIWLMRSQGLESLTRVLSRGRTDPREIVDAGFLIVAGLLLVLPGFMSDIAALALLVPVLRRMISGRAPGQSNARTEDDGVIEGRYEVIDEHGDDGAPPRRALDDRA